MEDGGMAKDAMIEDGKKLKAQGKKMMDHVITTKEKSM
jgi:hypothetical protein